MGPIEYPVVVKGHSLCPAVMSSGEPVLPGNTCKWLLIPLNTGRIARPAFPRVPSAAQQQHHPRTHWQSSFGVTSDLLNEKTLLGTEQPVPPDAAAHRKQQAAYFLPQFSAIIRYCCVPGNFLVNSQFYALDSLAKPD